MADDDEERDAEVLWISHPKKRAFLSALAQTGNICAAARAAGIDRRTHYRWLANDPEYRSAVDAAMEDAGDVLEAVARKRAIQGSDRLLIFLLRAIRPEKFRERREEAPVPVEAAHELSAVEQFQRLPIQVAERMAKAFPEMQRYLPEMIERARGHRKGPGML